MFRSGRRGLAERSNLIRHPSSKQSREEVLRMQQQQLSKNVSAENNNFVKDIVDQVFAGEGISWLKHNRLKKLLEDETYRNLTMGRLNKNLDRRIGPDDHVEDVVNTYVHSVSLELFPCMSSCLSPDSAWTARCGRAC